MGLKETIARWLAPELARNADRYWFPVCNARGPMVTPA